MNEKTRYTRAIQLRTAVADGDVESLADLLRNAEQAHAAFEKEQLGSGARDDDWPTWYAQWLLCRRDSFDAACAISTPVVSGAAQVEPYHLHHGMPAEDPMVVDSDTDVQQDDDGPLFGGYN